jgi:acyl-CoA thioester hydrolase
MERVKVSLPEQFTFSTILTIRITDLNYGGHTGNDVFLSLAHEARLQYLQHLGYTEMEMEGTSLIMADAAIEFKKELLYADQVKVSVQATGFDKYGFDLVYLMEVLREGQYLTAGKIKTGMLCFNYATRKIAPLPSAAVHKMSQPDMPDLS